MPYKMVTDVGKTCGRLAGAAFEHRELILDSLFEKFAHKLDSPEEQSMAARKLSASLRSPTDLGRKRIRVLDPLDLVVAASCLG